MNMKTYTVTKPKLMLTGVSVRTTNAEEAGPDGRLPKLWESYFNSKVAAISGIKNPNDIYALYTDYESDATGAYTTLIGHETAGAPAQDGNLFETKSIPESKYLVFQTTSGPANEVVAQAWQEIWSYFEDSPEVRTYKGDFELYDTRNYDPANTQIEIYIAIE